MHVTGSVAHALTVSSRPTLQMYSCRAVMEANAYA